MKALDAPTSVVVLKLEHYGSLGIVRSLGRMNIPVHGVDVHPDASAFLSRFCSGRFIWDIDNAPPEQSVEFLLDVGKRIGGNPLLIPTSDETALFVSEMQGCSASGSWCRVRTRGSSALYAAKRKCTSLRKSIQCRHQELCFPIRSVTS